MITSVLSFSFFKAIFLHSSQKSSTFAPDFKSVKIMKKITLLMYTVCTLLLTGCKNNQVGDEALLIGKWQVMSGKTYSATNSAINGETRDVSEYNMTWEFTESTATYAQDGKETTPWLYKLIRQDDNTLRLEMGGLVTGEEIGRLPYTIRKLTSSEMEWEHTFVGVTGTTITHEFLKKIN